MRYFRILSALVVTCLIYPIYAQEVIPEATQDGDKFLSEFMNMLTTLGLIVVGIFVVTWFLKRMLNVKIQQMNTNSLIKITERRSLSPKTALYLLEIGNKEIAIAETSNGVTVLAEFPVIESSKSKFQEILEQKSNDPQS